MYQFSLVPASVPNIETKHRKITTAIPSPETVAIIKEGMKYEPGSMHDQLPIVWERAEGYQVFDKSGNCWIDLTATIFVANVGHSHPAVVEAIHQMAEKKLLNAYYYSTEIRAALAKKLIEITPPHLDCVLFLSTGSETTEAAFKVTRMHGTRIRKSKDIMIAFEGSFHGKTMGAQTMGGNPGGKAWIGYHHPRIVHLEYPYPWVLKEKGMSGAAFFDDSMKKLEAKGIDLRDIAGFIAEPYQGWCAVFFPADYMQALREWATKNQSLLAFDEVQAGFGRTGKLFGHQHFGVEPDIICCGKALSSSIPVSAVIANRAILDVDLSLNSTHGGNPVGMAASLATINALLSENLVDESARKGILLRQELERWRANRPDYVHEIYGAGLLWGVFIRDPKTGELANDLVDQLIERAMQKGVVSIRTCRGTLKLGPPLTIPEDALTEAVEVLADSLDDCVGSSR